MSTPSSTGAATEAAADDDPFEDFLCFAVYSAGLAFNRVYKPILDRLGLTYVQYLVIVALGRRDDQTVGELGARLFLESNTLTPLIKRLESAGLVTRGRDARDERVVRVRLTEAGHAVAAEAACVPAELLATTGMDRTEAAEIKQALKHLRDQLRAV